MSEEAGVVAGGEVASATPAPVNDSPLTVREAVTAYAERTKRDDTNSSEGAQPAATETKSAVEADTAPQAEVHGETQANEPADLPPIEPPRSWTKDEKERFASFPRETQEYLANREQERDREFRTRQNEAAEQRKAADAEREQLGKVRQEYEAKLPALAKSLQDAYSQEFSDIRSMADVEKIANEIKRCEVDDPFRAMQLQNYLSRWQVFQQKMAAVNTELAQAEQRQAKEKQDQWSKFQQDETAKVLDRYPELKDPEKSKQFQTAAVELFRSAGFADSDLSAIANGEKLSPFHAGLQDIIMKAVKYDQLQKAPPKAVPKTVPQVQRPGVAQPKGAAADASVQALSQRLTNSGSIKDAFAMYQAKKAAAQR